MDKILLWFEHVDFFMYVFLILLAWLTVKFWKLDKTERWIATIVILYGATDLIASVMGFQQINNLWLYNLMLFPQFILVIILMVSEMDGDNVKRLMKLGCAGIVLLHLCNLMFFQGLHNFCNFSYIPATLWMATCSFFFLRQQMEKVEIVPFNHLITWFALATLIDNAGAVPILSVLGWTEFVNTSIAGHLWDIVTWLYAVWYLIILTGLLWTKTSLRSVFYSR